MRRVLVASLLVSCGGPAGTPPPQTVDAPVSSVSSAKPATLPLPDAPRPDRFPAGPGVSLITDDLEDVLHSPKLMTNGVSFEERLAYARETLGIPGDPIKDDAYDGFSFVAIGPKSVEGPYSCRELLISKGAIGATIRSTDHHRCGLPYQEDSSRLYQGPGPRSTVAKLRLMLFEVKGMDPLAAEQTVRKKLGAPEPTSQTPEWTGIGPRGHDAPFTCHVLTLTPAPQVFEASLDRCGLTWPLPASRFDSGPTIPAIDKPAMIADCQKTCGQDMCVISEKTPAGAILRQDADGLRAHYGDGRPARATITSSCVPVPASCSPVTAQCFFTPSQSGRPPSTGVCPKDDFSGFAFQGSPPHIECYARTKASPH